MQSVIGARGGSCVLHKCCVLHKICLSEPEIKCYDGHGHKKICSNKEEEESLGDVEED